MTTTHLTRVLAALKTVEEMGGIPAKAMKHTQMAIDRIERKLAKLAA